MTMKLNRRIMGFVGAAALIGGIGMGVSINRSAQPAVAFSSSVNSTKPDREDVADKPEGNEGSEGNTAPLTITKTNGNQVPASVSQVGESGENIYDAAQANNWTQAKAELNSLKNAAKRLDNESRINEDPNEDQLDGAIAALNQSVAARNQLVTMREANRVTRLAANLSKPFNPTVPVQVTLLDYYGRQLEVGAAAKDITQLSQTAKEISQTWNAVRPAVESRGGATQAQQFDNLIAKIAMTNSVDGYKRLATPMLRQVDALEKVFTK